MQLCAAWANSSKNRRRRRVRLAALLLVCAMIVIGHLQWTGRTLSSYYSIPINGTERKQQQIVGTNCMVSLGSSVDKETQQQQRNIVIEDGEPSFAYLFRQAVEKEVELNITQSITCDNNDNGELQQPCEIHFRDTQMNLCHFVPYGKNFGDYLGPAVVLKLLELYYSDTTSGGDSKHGSCSTNSVTVLNLAKIGNKRPDDLVCLFNLGSIFHMQQFRIHTCFYRA